MNQSNINDASALEGLSPAVAVSENGAESPLPETGARDSNSRNESESTRSSPKRLKTTVRDLPVLDVGTRRMKLDPGQSYGMSVRRPADESGTYKVLSSPDKHVEISKAGTSAKAIATRSSFSALPAIKEEVTVPIMVLKRVSARLIDFTILGIATGAIAMSYLSYAGRVVSESPELAPLFLNITYCLLPALAIAFVIAYNAFFEASLIMATPGKMLMGLVVKTKGGETLSLLTATTRAVLIHLPLIMLLAALCFVKLLNPALNSGASEVQMEGWPVVATVAFMSAIAYGVSLLWMAGNSRMQTLSDVLTGTLVEIH